jgi:hypothetical protein
MRTPFIFFIGLLLATDVFGEAAETETNHRISQTVDAVGFAERQDGESLNALHRRALKHALKNALLHAHVDVSIEASTRDMRMEEETILVETRGYVETSRMVEAGFIQDGSDTYRVRMIVLVSPQREQGQKNLLAPLDK